MRDASTGEPVARVSSTGVDVAGMVTHARGVGGPALRELTFHQRAAALKQLAGYLREHRDGLYQGLDRGHPRRRPGRRRRGHRHPVRLRQQGPPRAARRRPLRRRAAAAAGPGGTFVGQHVYSSRPGVAVFINAFNFPVWGMLEKLAPAVLAGMPAIVKPASQTAYVTELAFRHLVSSGALPPGSVQLLCGGVGDLFDHLGGQDAVAFTGSAATARRLRAHPAVIGEAVGSTPRPTRSTARSSAPTPPVGPRSSTCTWGRWSAS